MSFAEAFGDIFKQVMGHSLNKPRIRMTAAENAMNTDAQGRR